jgi:hypothetical protein
MKKFSLSLGRNGFGTVELVLLIAILVGIALLFKEFIVDYVDNLLTNITDVDINIKDISN